MSLDIILNFHGIITPVHIIPKIKNTCRVKANLYHSLKAEVRAQKVALASPNHLKVRRNRTFRSERRDGTLPQTMVNLMTILSLERRI